MLIYVQREELMGLTDKDVRDAFRKIECGSIVEMLDVLAASENGHAKRPTVFIRTRDGREHHLQFDDPRDLSKLSFGEHERAMYPVRNLEHLAMILAAWVRKHREISKATAAGYVQSQKKRSN